MTDVFTQKKRSEVMGRIRAKDTKPEITLRRALYKQGFRYRLHVKTLPGKPDIVLSSYRTTIQVRGCFWHGHNCIDGHIPKSRKAYWGPKITGNIKRDLRSDQALRKSGWSVIVVWACRLEKRKIMEQEIKRIVRHIHTKKKPEI